MATVRIQHKECTTPSELNRPQIDFFWKDYEPGEDYSDAIEPVDGKFIGQIFHDNCYLPATICSQTNTAITERKGKYVAKKNIKILCSSDPLRFCWRQVNFETDEGCDMEHAVEGGNEDGYYLYIGKVNDDSEWKFGKVVPVANSEEKGLHIWDSNGMPKIVTEFHVLKHKTGEDFFWRRYVHGKIPVDVVEGVDGKYIGQVSYQGYHLPATVQPNSHTATSEFDGCRIEVTENIRLLCSRNPKGFYWEPIDFSKATDADFLSTVKGGYQYGYDLRIGRVVHDDEWKIGKVVPLQLPEQTRGLQVWDKKGKLLAVTKFHILKYSHGFVPPEGCRLSSDFYWRDYVPGNIPCDAMPGAEGIFVAQALSGTEILPLHIHSNDEITINELMQKKIHKDDVKVLCSLNPQRFYWERMDLKQKGRNPLKNAVKGGSDAGVSVYIGRAYYEDDWQIGKVRPKGEATQLQLWDSKGAIVNVGQFEILKYLH